MRAVSAVLDALHVEHSLIYGSLLGALNFHDINPREVDNDFVVPHDFKLSLNVMSSFHDRGFHIFKDGIFRICRLKTENEKTSSHSPFSRAYFPYTDVYPAHYRPVFIEPTFMRTALATWNLTKTRVRDSWLPVPVHTFAHSFLILKYGSAYKNPENQKTFVGDKWKQRVREKEAQFRATTLR